MEFLPHLEYLNIKIFFYTASNDESIVFAGLCADRYVDLLMGSAMAVNPMFRGLAIGSDATSPTQHWFIRQQLEPGDKAPKIRAISPRSFRYYIPVYRDQIIVPRE